MKNKFPVAEIFDSIEGEGKRTGYMAVFVRFAGCNIRCTYCDTAYALKESDAEEFLTKEELLSCIRSYPWKRITFTGGEPLLQPLQEICDILGEEGYEINIETNGAVPLLARRPQNLFLYDGLQMHRQRNEVFHAAAELKGIDGGRCSEIRRLLENGFGGYEGNYYKIFSPGRSEVLCESRVGENRAA